MFWLKPLIQQLIHSYIFAFIISKTNSNQWIAGLTRHKSFWCLDQNVNVFHMQTSAFCTPTSLPPAVWGSFYIIDKSGSVRRGGMQDPPQEFISHFSWTVRNQLEPHCIVLRFSLFFLSLSGLHLPGTNHWKAKPGPVDIFTMNWWPARWNTYLNCLGAVCEVSLSKCLHTCLHISPHQKKIYLEIKVFIAANPQTTSSCAT